MKRSILIVVLALAAGLSAAQRPAGTLGALSPEAQRAVVRELSALVSLPNVATNQAELRLLLDEPGSPM